MAQFARPIADVATGVDNSEWSPSAGGDLFAVIDESSPNDNTDYIQSRLLPSQDIAVFQLGTVDDPLTHAGHVLRYRYRKNEASGDEIDLEVQLRQGYTSEASPGTLIATTTHSNISDSWTNGTINLSEAEAGDITDYTDLYVRFEAGSGDVEIVTFSTPGSDTWEVTAAAGGQPIIIEGWGGAFPGGDTAGSRGGPGGGAYSLVITTQAATTVLDLVVGDDAGTDTELSDGGGQILLAKSGSETTADTGALGGQAGSGVGTVTRSGGTGGDVVVVGADETGGGGGGAGGYYADGGNGVTTTGGAGRPGIWLVSGGDGGNGGGITGHGSPGTAPGGAGGSGGFQDDPPFDGDGGAGTAGRVIIYPEVRSALVTFAEFEVPDVADPFTGTGGFVVGAATLSGSAEYQVYTADADLVVGAAQMQASAEFDAPVYTAAAPLLVGAAQLQASAAHEESVSSGTAAVTAGAATLEAEATFAAGTKTATAALVAGAAVLTAEGTATAAYDGTAALVVGAATISGRVSTIYTPACLHIEDAVVTAVAISDAVLTSLEVADMTC